MDLPREEAAKLPKPLEPIDPPWFVRHDIFVRVKPMKGDRMKLKHWAQLTRDRSLVSTASTNDLSAL